MADDRLTDYNAAEKVSPAPVIVSMLVNLLLASAKGVAGFFGNSNAMIADAAESLSDVFSSIIVWLGIKTAVKAPDEDHPYGHGKAEPVASLGVVVFLITISILVASRAIGRLVHPGLLPPEAFTLYVLVGAILMKELIFRYMRSKARKSGSTALLTEALHNRTDAATSLVALIGILIAILGGAKFYSADAYASLIAAGIIAFNAISISKIALDELMDAAPPKELKDRVKSIPKSVPGVLEVEKCLLRKMGTSYWVDMHVVVDGKISVGDGHYIAHKVKDAIIHELPFITEVNVHIEPNVLTGNY